MKFLPELTTSQKPVYRHELAKALKSLLVYHKSCGIQNYPIDGSILPEREIYTARPEKPSIAERTGATGSTGHAEPPAPEKMVLEGGINPTMAELHAEIGRCRNCSLHLQRQVSTAGSGGGGSPPVKLLIVGDWLTVYPGSSVETGDLFGKDQDTMIARMINAIALRDENVFVTNVIKCSIPEMSQPTSEHIRCCSAYLEMQINLFHPQLICSMGIIASRLFTGQAKPLSQQRGQFHIYKTGSGKSVPVMPTYHPTFLLQNPEMKQAAWADLQAIKKKLDGS